LPYRMVMSVYPMNLNAAVRGIKFLNNREEGI
jgi:hypothetical protein